MSISDTTPVAEPITAAADAAPIPHDQLPNPPVPPAADVPPQSGPRKRVRDRSKAALQAKAAERDRLAAGGKPKAAPRPAAAGPLPSLEGELQAVLAFLAMGAGSRNDVDGLIIAQNTPRLAAALDRMAQQNPAFHETLTRLLVGSALQDLLIAGVMIAVPLAANHGAKVPLGRKMLAPYRKQLGLADLPDEPADLAPETEPLAEQPAQPADHQPVWNRAEPIPFTESPA